MKRFLKHLYGSGILFFYYTKWIIFLGLPALYYGADYKNNPIMNAIWFFCLVLIIKDLVVLVRNRHKN